ncbi:MAG: pesticin C-terminus-like muramidase, partial [Candidatus Woesearchaeota archaeon]
GMTLVLIEPTTNKTTTETTPIPTEKILVQVAAMEIEDLIEIDKLIELEGYRSRPYVLPPEKFPRSGITLGWGVDLGQWDEKEVRLILSKYFPPERYEKVFNAIRPFLGKKGEEARMLIFQAHKALTPREVFELSVAFAHFFLDRIARLIPNFHRLPKNVRTVIFSIAWHRGLSVVQSKRGFGRVIQALREERIKDAKKILADLAKLDARFTKRYNKTALFLG